MKTAFKKTFSILSGALLILACHGRADEPMSKYRELVLKIDEFRQLDEEAEKFLSGRQGKFETNLVKNGWRKSPLSNNYSLLDNNLGKINGKYTLYHRIITDEELRNSAISSELDAALVSQMLNLGSLPLAALDVPESQPVIDTRAKLRRAKERLSVSSKFTVAIGLHDGDRGRALAIVESNDNSAVPTISISIVDTVLDGLRMALEMADKARANAAKNYTRGLNMRGGNVIFSVDSNSTPRVYIAATAEDAPDGRFEIAMGEIKSIITLLEEAKSKLNRILQISAAEARKDAANEIRNARIFGDGKKMEGDGVASTAASLPELQDSAIQTYFKANPNMFSEVLNLAKELLAGKDYDQTVALCDILTKYNPNNATLQRFKDLIVKEKFDEDLRQEKARIKAFLNGRNYDSALTACETALKQAPHDAELSQLKSLIISTKELNKLPELIKAPLPQHPGSGKVSVRFVVDATGKIVDSSIKAVPAYKDRNGETIKKLSIDAVKKWKFKPGLENGRPTDREVETTIFFNAANNSVSMSQISDALKIDSTLLDDAGNNIDKIYELSALDKMPEARGYRGPSEYPYELKRQGIGGEVVLEFIVDDKGDVRDVNVVSSTHREFEFRAILAVQKWKFRPGRKAGKAVATRMQMSFSFGLNDDE